MGEARRAGPVDVAEAVEMEMRASLVRMLGKERENGGAARPARP